VRILGLANEREPAAGIERGVLERLGPIGDAGDRDDADPLVLPPNSLARRCITQEEPALSALEPEAQPFGQNSSSFRTASVTRSTDGMYASSICQYG
jgi:hypothetical protein